MITYSVIEDQLSGSIGEKPFSVPADPELIKALDKVNEELEEITDPEEYKKKLEEAEGLVVNDLDTVIETECEYIRIDRKTGKYYLHYNGVKSSIAMPEALVDRIKASQDKGVDYMPLIRFWVRFLRNPVLPRKGKRERFAKKLFNFINMKYVHPELREKFIEDGFSEKVATERATVYQMKITKEGLLNGYKVSREIDYKFEASEDNQSAVKVPRYQRTFDVNTGKITSEGKPEKVEDRLFEPAMMGNGGDPFSCKGDNGFDELGHFIKVGCTHALDNWDQVNCDDDVSCVPGLHFGGLYYINGYSGEIHNVFVDPMHIGAVPDDNIGAIRCKQYFVHSSLAGVNGSIYHSSTYAKVTDEEWKEMVAEASKLKLEEIEKQKEELEAQGSLTLDEGA